MQFLTMAREIEWLNMLYALYIWCSFRDYAIVKAVLILCSTGSKPFPGPMLVVNISRNSEVSANASYIHKFLFGAYICCKFENGLI